MPPATTARFQHNTSLTPASNRGAYNHGQRQAAIALERYHTLRAAIIGQFDVVAVPPDPAHGQLFPRSAIVFNRYTEAQIPPVSGVKLHPREDGTVHPDDLKLYVRGYRNNWKCREGGVLYCIGEPREFWNMVLNYRSSERTTGWRPWDRLFTRLQESDFDKGLVPCMFYARASGCMSPQCPFLHDREKCLADRQKILDKRRQRLARPTPRDTFAWQKRQMQEYQCSQRQVVPVPRAAPRRTQDVRSWDEEDVLSSDDEDDVDPGVEHIWNESRRIRMICNNPECLRVTMRDGAGEDGIEMRRCSGCHVATYCSPECQRAHWRKHKAQPCRPLEELIEDDELWDEFGLLKGTSRIPIHTVQRMDLPRIFSNQ